MELRARVGAHRGLTAVAVAGTAVVVAVLAATLGRGRSLEVAYGLYLIVNGPSAVVLLLWMSRLVLLRRPGHLAGADPAHDRPAARGTCRGRPARRHPAGRRRDHGAADRV